MGDETVTVVVAVIVGVTTLSASFIAPLLMSRYSGRNARAMAQEAGEAARLLAEQTAEEHRREKAEDWAREDAVAAKAAALAEAQRVAAAKASADAAEAARLLAEQNRIVADTAALTIGKLDVIHTLVNSKMTEAMDNELAATRRELAGMLEIVRLREAAGSGPLPVAQQAIALTQSRIAELEHALDDRRRAATVVADKEQVAAANGLGSGSKPL